jgi:hypothetical protein
VSVLLWSRSRSEPPIAAKGHTGAEWRERRGFFQSLCRLEE